MDSILDFTENWDMELANDDYSKDIISSTSIVSDSLALHFDINSSNSFTGLTTDGSPIKLTSLVQWSGVKTGSTSTITLSDVGLTMSDWGRFTKLTGETLTIDVTGSTKMKLYSVSGLTGSSSSYNISSASTSSIGTYLSLSGGGYFSGFWKLSGYEYEILPPRTEQGWFFENWLKFSGQSNNTNSNFFLYMGVKQEDKYWNIYAVESGYNTTSGITLSPPVSANTDLDLANNVLAFRFSGDTIGWRKLSASTNCSNIVTGVTVQEGYSKHGIFDNFSGATENDWIHVGIRFKKYNLIDECTINSGTTSYHGDLTFYINARPIYNVPNFEEPMFKSLSTHKTKQEGVPFSLQWGGGSFGLKESNTFGNLDVLDTGKTIQNNFSGNLNGGISQLRFYVVPLSVDKIIHNFEIEKSRYRRTETFGGRQIRINKGILF